MNPADFRSPLLSRSAWERLGHLDYMILPEFGYTKQAPSSEALDPLLLTDDPLQSHIVDTVGFQDDHSEWASQGLAHKNIPTILFPALREDQLPFGLVDPARWRQRSPAPRSRNRSSLTMWSLGEDQLIQA